MVTSTYSQFLGCRPRKSGETLGGKRSRPSGLTAETGIRILTYMTLDDLTRDQRVQLLLHDSSRYIRLMSESDIDRLLANLAKRPIRKHTRDWDDMMQARRERAERYPSREEATEPYIDYLT